MTRIAISFQRWRNLIFSKLDLDSPVEDSALRVGVDFAEGWVLMRRKNNEPETALACISDVLGINE